MAGTENALLILFRSRRTFAATVNGALGYGFSSLTVPLALLFFQNKILSPAPGSGRTGDQLTGWW